MSNPRNYLRSLGRRFCTVEAGKNSWVRSSPMGGGKMSGGKSLKSITVDLDCVEGQPESDSGIWKRGAPITGLLQRRSIRTKLLFGVITLAVTIVMLTLVGLVGFYRYRSLADAISTRARELPMATDLSVRATAVRDCNTRICQMKSHEGMIDSFGLSGSSMLAHSDLELVRKSFDLAMYDLYSAFNRYAHAIGINRPLDEWEIRDQSFPHDATGSAPAGHGDTFQRDAVVVMDVQHSLGQGEGISRSHPIESGDLAETLIDTEVQRDSLIALGIAIRQLNDKRLNQLSLAVPFEERDNQLSKPLSSLVDETHKHLGLIHGQMASFSNHVKTQHRVGIAGAWIALAIATVITISMVWYFQMMVIGPFSNLVMGARLVARGEYRHRIEMGSDDEIGELGEILNEVTDRFQQSLLEIQTICREKDEEVKIRSREVIRNEQLAGIGFLAAGFAHEINNPMAAIAWSAESLESRVNDLLMIPEHDRLVDEELMETLQENLQRIQGEAYRCKSITERMLSFSRVGHVERESVDVSPLVNDVVEMIGTLGQYKCKEIHVDASESVTAYANSQEIRQVILNLVTNAMESVDGEGRVDIVLRNDGGFASVRVRDSGCGMTPEVMQHLFEPFYTRRRDGSGTGLGLSISYRIVSQHGGQLIPRSDGDGLGSEFELRLPIQKAAERGDSQTHNNSMPAQNWRDAERQAA